MSFNASIDSRFSGLIGSVEPQQLADKYRVKVAKHSRALFCDFYLSLFFNGLPMGFMPIKSRTFCRSTECS